MVFDIIRYSGKRKYVVFRESKKGDLELDELGKLILGGILLLILIFIISYIIGGEFGNQKENVKDSFKIFR